MSIFKQEQSTNFSIVLPSLRWEWIRTVLNSIYDNATYPDMVDTHIAINTGDMRIKAILDKYREKNKQVYYYEIDPADMTYGGQNYPGIVKYVNTLTLEYSKGKYIMPMNDDAIFTMKDWDSNSLSKLPDDIVLGLTNDNIRPKGFDGRLIPACSFPIISRVGIEYHGYLFAPFFYHNTADTHICSVYYDMKKTINLEDIVYIAHRPKELCEFIPTDYLTEVAKC
jgi:hypothetical protein